MTKTAGGQRARKNSAKEDEIDDKRNVQASNILTTKTTSLHLSKPNKTQRNPKTTSPNKSTTVRKRATTSETRSSQPARGEGNNGQKKKAQRNPACAEYTSPVEMKSFPLSCRVANACAVTLPFAVATNLPGLRPPRLDINGAECLQGGRGAREHARGGQTQIMSKLMGGGGGSPWGFQKQ